MPFKLKFKWGNYAQPKRKPIAPPTEAPPKPARPPLAFRYGRISHANGFEGDSVPAQDSRTKGYLEYQLTSENIGDGGFFDDGKNVSAYRVPFMKRPAGRQLTELMQPGDHIIFDKVDRIWRSNEDFVDLMRWFRARQITVHFVSFSGCSIRMGTPMGDWVLRSMVSNAELESARTSERIREAKARLRASGMSQGTMPIGCRLVRTASGQFASPRRLEWCPDRRAEMKEIVRLIDDCGFSYREVANLFETTLRARVGQTFTPLPSRESTDSKDRFWTFTRVQKGYRREKALLALGCDPDPNTINFMDFEKRYLQSLEREAECA